MTMSLKRRILFNLCKILFNLLELLDSCAGSGPSFSALNIFISVCILLELSALVLSHHHDMSVSSFTHQTLDLKASDFLNFSAICSAVLIQGCGQHRDLVTLRLQV